MKGANLYRANQFATRVGVTVRTLHYYDRLGLLRPSGRTEAGYRLYAESDVARLEQIVALKFIGFPLKQIRELLNRKALGLASALRLQRTIMEEKRRQLELAIQAIEYAEQSVLVRTGRKTSRDPGRRGRGPDGADDWEAFRKIIEVINMQQNMDWTKKYYSEEAQADLAERRTAWSSEMLRKAEQDWAALIRDVEAAVAAGEDPAGANAQALSARWAKLLEGFTGGNPEVQKGLNRMYADQKSWPTTFKKPYSDEVGAFICKAAEFASKAS
jgi:MerR family transcriptional regulator, thiopeptide resistance regulator